ncbi:hypothetical protein WEN_02645 [Mycoplasma wenyonii str. Massachusetts]|uniref:Uncharacterized protein n=1 Tax=Mycoplasma wenyonii (strain Massachusetts) TaxID=1197325 RepID=I6YM02_MYCWM|nr:hypothetical protein WEN_02645 [Mycoplasma wenyonii str. Massachusetts]
MPFLHYVLSDGISGGNRQYKVTLEFKALEREKGDGKMRYQGMPIINKLCMGNARDFENVYDVVFNGPSLNSRAIGKTAKHGYSIKEPFEVIEKSIFVSGGKKNSTSFNHRQRLSEKIKENLRLVVYKDISGSFGMLLVGSVNDTWKEYGLDNLASQVDESSIERFKDVIKAGKFAVRRSLKGVWSPLTSNTGGKKCEHSLASKANPIYKNYGVLVEEWKEETKSAGIDKAKAGIFEGVVVLDWVDFGFNAVTKEEGTWIGPTLSQESSSQRFNGRWDYLRLQNSEKPLEVIVGRLEDIEINSEGIKNGKGEKITWSNKFRPTIIATLEK